jgi:hypothetical protein
MRTAFKSLRQRSGKAIKVFGYFDFPLPKAQSAGLFVQIISRQFSHWMARLADYNLFPTQDPRDQPVQMPLGLLNTDNLHRRSFESVPNCVYLCADSHRRAADINAGRCFDQSCRMAGSKSAPFGQTNVWTWVWFPSRLQK